MDLCQIWSKSAHLLGRKLILQLNVMRKASGGDIVFYLPSQQKSAKSDRVNKKIDD